MKSGVDQILSRHQLVWKLNPYRIEDKNGNIIQAKLHFDIRDSALKKRYNASLAKIKSRFGIPVPPQK